MPTHEPAPVSDQAATTNVADETKREELPPGVQRRVLLGSLAGSAIEWFDFFLYATAATLIFDKQFFPVEDPVVSQLLAYFALALTFFVRPFGGILFAHIGDRIGRKKTLVVTLTLMGGATVAIGCLPTYEQVGVLAPILLVLLRIIQGLAIAGEWGGALLLAYEYAPPHRRGFFGSVPQTGVTVGMLMSTLALAVVTSLPGNAFDEWAWRIPFIASIILVAVGLWIRKGLNETPHFQKIQKTDSVAKMPLADTLRDHWRSVLVAVGVKFAETAPFYIWATFVVGYASDVLGYERFTALNAVSAGAVVSMVMIVVMGSLSDRVGRRPVYLTGVLLTSVVAIPFFLLLDLRETWAIYAGVILALGLVWPPVTATLGTMMSETFSARVRYTGITLGYQIGAAIAGGTAPMVATWLMAEFNQSWVPVAVYVGILAVISFIAALCSPGAVRREQAQLERRNAAAVN